MNLRMKNQVYGTIRTTRKVHFLLYGVQIITFIALNCTEAFDASVLSSYVY